MEEDYEQDEYDDYADYEEVDGSEAEEEEGEEEEYEEEPAPTKEELEFLKLREKLKEEFRQKLKKQNGSASDRSSPSQGINRPVANDKFGSFFGPSKPVIAARVLEESRSILETRHVVAKAAPSSDSQNKKGQLKTSAPGQQQQQKVTELSKAASKAKVLKEMRDYSFLLSDDAEFPAPAKEEPAPPKAPAPSSGNAVRPAAGNLRQVPRKVPGQSSANKPARLVANGHQKNSVSASQHPQSKMGSKVVARKTGNAITGNGAGRPVGREAPPQRVSAPGAGGTRPPAKIVNGSSGIKKPLPAKIQSSEQRRVGQERRVGQGQDRIKAAPRPPLASSRNQVGKPSSAHNVSEERSKKRPLRRDPFEEDDPDDISRQIRSMFNYNPDKYRDLDRMDDRDMEVGFDSIMKEEQRSLRIAREEDAEQLRLIEEEEKRERMRKKQKLSRK